MRKTFKVVCKSGSSEKDYDDFDYLGLSLESKDNSFFVVGLAEDFDYLAFTKDSEKDVSPLMREVINSWKSSDFEAM